MPHAADDLASADEVKIYKDEGDEENRASENLSEDKIVLVTETEEDKRLEDGDDGSNTENAGSKLRSLMGTSGFFDFGAFPPPTYPWIAPYPPPGSAYHGGPSAAAAAAAAMAAGLGRFQSPHAGSLGLYLYGSDPLSHPPPAHMGIPPLRIDHKTGFPRPPTLYSLPTPSNPLLYPFYAPDFSKCWSSLTGYRLPSAFPTPYPPLNGSPLSPFGPSPGLFTPPPLSPSGKHRNSSSLSSRSAALSPRPGRDLFQMSNHLDSPRHRLVLSHRRSEYGSTGVPSPPESLPQPSPRRPVVKKPLNAFMLFMKEMRQKVIDECTLKESAAINQILGRKWHALDKAEQAKYYEMARKEKELHMQLYPGWSARDNYGLHSKKKRKLFSRDEPGMMKKCHSQFSSGEEGPWYPSTRSDSDSEHSSSASLNICGVNSALMTSATIS